MIGKVEESNGLPEKCSRDMNPNFAEVRIKYPSPVPPLRGPASQQEIGYNVQPTLWRSPR